MRQAVEQPFFEATRDLEGEVDHLYADIKGLMTIAWGVLVDPVVYATQLQLRHRDTGAMATKDEIIAEWFRISRECCGDYRNPRHCPWRGTGRTCMAHQGHRAARRVARLHLPLDDMRALFKRKLAQIESHLRGRFKDAYDEAPADGQFGILSMAWAAGPAFRFPLFEAHLRAGDYRSAAQECGLKESNNPGVVPRNAMNRTLFRNAARVVEDGLDPDVLYWPRDLEDDRPTSPDLSVYGLDDPALEEDGGVSRHVATRNDVIDSILREVRKRGGNDAA